VSLLVSIHQQDARVRRICRAQDLHQSKGNVGGGGGLAHTALMVREYKCAGHELSPL
jgi:hypothetical protein